VFSADSSKLISNADDLTYEVWETQGWKPASPLPREGPGGIGVVFSRNSEIFAVGLSAERVRLVDAQSQRPLSNLSAGRPLMLSDSGRWLLTLRRDQSVELWDLGRIRAQLRDLKLDWDAKPLPQFERQPRTKGDERSR
jgi:WD40 repeat protein